MKHGEIELQSPLGLTTFISDAFRLDLSQMTKRYLLYCYNGTAQNADSGDPLDSAQWRLPPASACEGWVMWFQNKNRGNVTSVKLVSYLVGFPNDGSGNGDLSTGNNIEYPFLKLKSGDAIWMEAYNGKWNYLFRRRVGADTVT
jgi:hypothetical protein